MNSVSFASTLLNILSERNSRREGFKAWTHVWWAAAAFAYGSTALAQSDSTANGSELEEIIVTAEQRSENLQKVPISMSVFEREFIDQYIRDVFSLQDFTPNLQLSEGNGFRQMDAGALRGIGLEERTTSISSNSILTYYDDIPIGTPFAAGIPQWDLERVEVLRGPQGTLYGRNALAGAIRWISARPTDELSGYGRFTFGEYDLAHFEGAVSGRVSENAKARVSAVVHNVDGYVTSVNTNTTLGEREWYGVRGIVDWQPSDKFDASFKVQYWEGDQDNLFFNAAPSELFEPILQDQFAAEGTDPDLDWQSEYTQVNSQLRDPFEKLDLTLTQVNLNYDFGPVMITSVTGYMEGESTAFFDFRNRKPAIQYIAIGMDDPTSIEQWTQEIRLTSQTDHPLQWIAGAYYQETDDANGSIAVSIGPLVPASIIPAGGTLGSFSPMGSFGYLSTYALFLHSTYNWTSNFKTTQSLRYTNEARSTDFGLNTVIYYPISPGATVGSVQAEGYDLLPFARLTHAERRAVAMANFSDHFSGGILSDPNELDANGNAVPRHLSDSWDEVTWRLAADYSVGDQALVYGSVSTGFKGGTFAINAVGGARAGVEPETSLVYEVGAKTVWFDDRLQINAAIFYNDHRDLQANQFVSVISPVTGALVGFFKLENLPKVKVSGVEISMRMVPIRNLDILLNLGFLESEIIEVVPGVENEAIVGNELPLVADKNFSAQMGYAFHTRIGTFRPAVSTRYIGTWWSNKDNDDLTGKLGDYWVSQARLDYYSASGRVNAAFYIRNIFDEVQPTWSNTARPDTTTGTTSSRVNAHRNWGITIGYKF